MKRDLYTDTKLHVEVCVCRSKQHLWLFPHIVQGCSKVFQGSMAQVKHIVSGGGGGGMGALSPGKSCERRSFLRSISGPNLIICSATPANRILKVATPTLCEEVLVQLQISLHNT